MSRAVATIKDVDEYGPIIEWHQHWAELKGRTLHLTQPAQAVDVRFFASGPEGHFYADDHMLATQLISRAGFDRDDWTITDIAAPPNANGKESPDAAR